MNSLSTSDGCIHHLFETQAARTPAAVAVVCRETHLTYGGLNARASRLAHRLVERGVGPDTLVAVCLERSPELIVALLAILKAGGAYVPLDLSYPLERLAFMLQDTEAPVILTRQRFLEHLPPTAACVECLDEDAGPVPEGAARNPGLRVSPENLAYVMYTSGSTGIPKGVLIPHQGIVRLVVDTDYAQFGPGETFLQLSPVSFDASTLEIWGPLLHGGRCVLFPDQLPTAREIGRTIREHGVTTLWLTASLFNAVIDEEPTALAGLRQLLVGGEALSVSHVRRALALLPGTQLINGYGPTESTTFTCCYAIPRCLEPGARSIPIGQPIRRTYVHILDGDMRPVSDGASGELFVGGDGLAHGYLKRPSLTDERFVPDPFTPRRGARLYRTGDLVRRLPDGNIEFLGRLDQQVKIHGFRIELGEIEAVLQQHPGVRQAAVVVRDDTSPGKRLVAYYTPEGTGATDPAELKAHLQDRLPAYMVPSLFAPVAAMPLTPNGKLDRAALPALPAPSGSTYVPEIAALSSMEEMVRRAWMDVLDVDCVGLHDNFFDLGGQSLHLVRLHSKLASSLQGELPITVLFQYPTVHSLAQHLGRNPVRPSFDQLQDRSRRQRAAVVRQRQLARGRS